MRILASVLALFVLAAGCVTLPSPEGASGPDDGTTTSAATTGDEDMDARESKTDAVAPCRGDSGRQCATRTHRIEGALRLSSLDVTLRSFNGPVTLVSGSAGKWSLEATVSARGDTESEATAARDAIKFSWSHFEGGRHVVRAAAEPPARTSHNEGAALRLTLPAAVLIEATLKTTNGPVFVDGATLAGLSVQTTNGPVTLDASASNVAATTTNGPITASLVPGGDGSVSLSTTNGPLMLKVPETAREGYDITAKTTNGQVMIGLQDGAHGSAGGSKTFRTNGYEEREVRSVVQVSATNGPVSIMSN